nr:MULTISPECIES: hypothetical protein [unclassified Anoxybacillus]
MARKKCSWFFCGSAGRFEYEGGGLISLPFPVTMLSCLTTFPFFISGSLPPSVCMLFAGDGPARNVKILGLQTSHFVPAFVCKFNMTAPKYFYIHSLGGIGIKNIKPGRGPSLQGFVGSIAAVVFGIFWMGMAFSITRDSPFEATRFLS